MWICGFSWKKKKKKYVATVARENFMSIMQAGSFTYRRSLQRKFSLQRNLAGRASEYCFVVNSAGSEPVAASLIRKSGSIISIHFRRVARLISKGVNSVSKTGLRSWRFNRMFQLRVARRWRRIASLLAKITTAQPISTRWLARCLADSLWKFIERLLTTSLSLVQGGYHRWTRFDQKRTCRKTDLDFEFLKSKEIFLYVVFYSSRR